jgi:serine-type D-Ala-D-Ala endopeptidase (penicillin-binding protein 7)
MLLDFFISIILFPNLWTQNLNSDGFLNLGNQVKGIQLADVVPKRIYTDVLDVRITAKSAIAVDVKSSKILYKKNNQEILPIASITKLMTGLVFLEHNPGWQNTITILDSDHRNGGTSYLKTGETLTLKDLFATALIVSDNEAAVALARSTGKSEFDFVAAMNKKASELGLKNSKFVEPTGLDAGNSSTAEDVAKLLNFALQNQAIKEMTSLADYEFKIQNKDKDRQVKLKNTDLLLKGYLDVLGGKTGSLLEAGYCLAIKIKGDSGQEIIIAVLDSQTNLDRFQDVKAISDWVYTNYKWSEKK